MLSPGYNSSLLLLDPSSCLIVASLELPAQCDTQLLLSAGSSNSTSNTSSVLAFCRAAYGGSTHNGAFLLTVNTEQPEPELLLSSASLIPTNVTNGPEAFGRPIWNTHDQQLVFFGYYASDRGSWRLITLDPLTLTFSKSSFTFYNYGSAIFFNGLQAISPDGSAYVVALGAAGVQPAIALFSTHNGAYIGSIARSSQDVQIVNVASMSRSFALGGNISSSSSRRNESEQFNVTVSPVNFSHRTLGQSLSLADVFAFASYQPYHTASVGSYLFLEVLNIIVPGYNNSSHNNNQQGKNGYAAIVQIDVSGVVPREVARSQCDYEAVSMAATRSYVAVGLALTAIEPLGVILFSLQ